MTAAIYSRVSTIRQHTENQIPELRSYAERNQWDVIEYLEEASGKQGGKRPVLARLLEDARDGKFQVVIVWKMDRFGRSIKDFVANIAVLNDLNVRFICTSQPIDTDQRSPFGKMIMMLLMLFAEFERDLIAERIVLGVQRAQREEASGIQRITRTGRNCPIGRPRKVWARGKAADMHAAGMSVRKIAAALDQSVMAVQRAIKANAA